MKHFLKKSAIIVIAIVIVFYAGFRLGFSQRPSYIVSDDSNPLDVDFSLFWDAIDLAKNKFVNADNIKDKDFLYGAIRGALSSLDDPYSGFFEPVDAQKLDEDLTGSFGGIGAEIGVKNNQLIVIAPLKNNPAEKVGLKAGDKILAINGTSTADITVEKAVKMIRGKTGTQVVLSIFRDGFEEAKDFKIIRQIIVVPTLDWEMKTSDIAYVQLYSFNANAESLFYQAALSALVKGARGMVLDLRNDPGGFLDTAVDIAGWFLKKGEIVVVEKFRSGEKKYLRANGNSALNNMPVVILVNGGSASASEILAGALKDNRGIKLVGEKTFGKGSVQELENLKDGSTLKISIAEWLTPKGTAINKKGIIPDYEIKPAEKKDDKNKNEFKSDPQLDKAMDILKEEIIDLDKKLGRI